MATQLASFFTFNGQLMDSGDFGNYLAGFEGGIYDRAYGANIGLAQKAVEAAGVMFHMLGLTKAKNDPWDHTGMPFIKAGEKEADPSAFVPHLLEKAKACGCNK